ncbi:MAG: hypothetical protein H6631_15720 [Anaerolineaceae bacterium]|nr:hypothetical protein [Anaerolineaceae bacterium]
MFKINLLRWASLVLFVPILTCTTARATPEPRPTLQQLAFDIQTATPTVSLLFDAPTPTIDPNATPTSTPTLTPTLVLTATVTVTPTETIEEAAAPPPASEPVQEIIPTPPPEPTATVPLAPPVFGGEWDFEAGFTEWANPHADRCDGAKLAIGWNAFTTRDQFGSSCMNQNTWADNVYSGQNSQEITFAFIGNEAGIYKSTPTVPGHQYKIEVFVRREFSPAKVEVSLGLDPTGGGDYLAESVQWFPWDDDAEDAWSRTEETITATGGSLTIYIKGFHPRPEGGGALRIDNITITDLGPGGPDSGSDEG